MERILLSHGSGGLQSQRLIKDIIYPIFNNNWDNPLLDGAVLPKKEGTLVVSTDSFVVTPLFFPGGDIGKLAVCGTVNDLLCMGAVPYYLTVALIIEEGLEVKELTNILRSMAGAAAEAGVAIVTGDTKVVERGNADGLFINTTGIGFIPANRNIQPSQIQTGDVVLVTGDIGDHGMAILSQREGLAFSRPIASDCAPLNGMMEEALAMSSGISCMRDPTRGGLATALNELAQEGNVTIEINEELIPINSTVQAGCDMLGLDPLYMANEGKLIVIVRQNQAYEVLDRIRKHPYGKKAAIIGQVTGAKPGGKVLMETILKTKRILPMLEGEHLPRIC